MEISVKVDQLRGLCYGLHVKKVVAWTRVNLKKGSEQRLWVYFEDNINGIC